MITHRPEHESIPGVSVVVPCFNSATRLPETLDHLARQVVAPGIPWEVIVVDNASTDETSKVAADLWMRLDVKTPFQVVKQAVPGLSSARSKGFETARYEYVLFCDDDNWLDSDYVQLAYELMMDNPQVGALGGWGEPQCETSPPEWFEKYKHYYAVGPQETASGDITEFKGYVYGAGFVIRKAGWHRLRQNHFDFQVSDRRGSTLSANGDVELCYSLRLIGYRIWYDERLRFTHFITRNRLDWRYFLRLVTGAHEGVPVMEAYLLALAPGEPVKADVSRSRWLRESSRLLRRMGSKWRPLIKSALWPSEGSSAIKMFHQWKGLVSGWMTVRSRFPELVHRLREMRLTSERETE